MYDKANAKFVFNKMCKHFNMSDLKVLAFELQIDWDELHGTVKSEKVISLLALAGQNQQLSQLTDLLQDKRAFIDWPDLKSEHLIGSLSFDTKPTTANQIKVTDGGRIHVRRTIEQQGDKNSIEVDGQGSNLVAGDLAQSDPSES